MSKSKIKVCIIGASGFVGRALVERLLGREEMDITAVIQSPGNARPILRHELEIVHADVLNVDSLREAINGCTHVVNLSLGTFGEMVKGISNIIQVCNDCEVKRLVHLSSITVYGDSPYEESALETGPVLAKKRTYGWFKAQQDLIVEKANGSGLSSVVLCPPHITGAYGRIFHQVIDSISAGTFALIDGGSYPCNLVDINNLCAAIEAGLFVPHSDGKRIFVTNGDNYTWKDLADKAAEIAGVDPEDIPSIAASELVKISAPKISLFQFVAKIIKSPETKSYVMGTFVGRNKILRGIAKKTAGAFDSSRSKKSLLLETVNNNSPQINDGLCRQQLRGVRHKIDKAKKVLNYTPKVSSAQSFEVFDDYYKALFGYGSEYWNLVNK